MAVAVALWSLTVTPGDPTVITPPADLRITNVALGDEIANENSRTTLKVTYRTPGAGAGDEDEDEDEDEEDEEEAGKPEELSTAVLCSLTFGKIEQTTVNIVLSEDEEYLFELIGKNTVHLTGNYIDQRPPDQDPYSEEESEDDFDLRDVSSDVEINPDELDIPSDDGGRFEEKEAPKNESKKRPREPDAMDTQEPGPEPEENLSKSQKKKLKKLKAANGGAVEAPTPEKSDKTKEKANKKEKGDKKVKTKGGEPRTLQGGVQVVDHKVGTGPMAKSGHSVLMRYIGKLQSGKVFDQNMKGSPFKFRLGEGEVIKGWDVGIAGMQVGGERLLTIPAPMGYGKQAQAGIPANSTLIFEVKLLEIK